MTVLHTGSTKAYSGNWEQIFGGSGQAASKAKAGKGAAGKKKPVARKARKKSR